MATIRKATQRSWDLKSAKCTIVSRCGAVSRNAAAVIAAITTRRATAVNRGRRPATTRTKDPDEAAGRRYGNHLGGRLGDRSAADVEQHRVAEGARRGDRCRWPVAGQPNVEQFTDRDQNGERDRDVRASHAMDAGRHRSRRPLHRTRARRRFARRLLNRCSRGRPRSALTSRDLLLVADAEGGLERERQRQCRSTDRRDHGRPAARDRRHRRLHRRWPANH